MNVRALRLGLAANLAPLTRGWQVSPYLLSNPTLPSIALIPDETDYNWRGGGGSHIQFRLQALVGVGTDQGAQELLDALISDEGEASIKRLLEAEPTLAGAASDVNVATCTGHQTYPLEGRPPAIGAEWTVEVLC